MPDSVMPAREPAAMAEQELPATCRSSRLWRLLLLLGLAAVLLIPIWSVRYPPLADYPNHLASAYVVAHFQDPAMHFSRYYSVVWGLNPYLITDWILIGLQSLLPIGVAGRLLLSVGAIGVPAGTWFFLRRANPGQDGLALWSLLLAENLYFFLYGMINIQLSLALCLVVLGIWLDFLAKPRAAVWVLLLALTTLLYFTHIVGFGIAGFVATTYAIFSRQRLSRLLLSWLLFLPGAIVFFHQHHGSQPGAAWVWQVRTALAKIEGLFSVMIGAYPSLDFLTIAILLLCILLAVSGNREFAWNRRWLGVTALLLALYWIFPARYGPGFNADRALLPFLFIVALSTARVGKRMRQLAAIALILFLVRTAALERKFIREQPGLAGMAQAFSVIPRNETMLPLEGWAGGNPLPAGSLWGYGVIERGWLSPCLFHDPGVEPLQLAPGLYDAACDPIAGGPDTVDWSSVAREYHYVWAADVPQLSAQLATMGNLIFQSGNLRIYRISAAPPRQTPH